MKNTILGGILLLIPLAVLVIVAEKVISLSLRIARPIGRALPFNEVAGIALSNLLAIILILLVCLLAGLVARSTILSARMDNLDRFVVAAIPGYAVVKVTLGAVLGEDGAAPRLKPVIARFDDYSQIAFEIERNDAVAIVFLPGSPTVFSGASLIVDVDRITPLSLSTFKTAGLLQFLGRGLTHLPEIKALEISAD